MPDESYSFHKEVIQVAQTQWDSASRSEVETGRLLSAMKCWVRRGNYGGSLVPAALGPHIAADIIFQRLTATIAEEYIQPSAGAPDFTVDISTHQTRPAYTLKVRGGFGFRLIVCDWGRVNWQERKEWAKENAFPLSFQITAKGGVELPAVDEENQGWGRYHFYTVRELEEYLPRLCEAVVNAYNQHQQDKVEKRNAKKAERQKAKAKAKPKALGRSLLVDEGEEDIAAQPVTLPSRRGMLF